MTKKLETSSEGPKAPQVDGKEDILVPDPEDVPGMLRQLLKCSGRSLSEAASAAELGVSQLSRCLNSKAPMPLGVVDKIAKILERSLLVAFPRIKHSGEKDARLAWPLAPALLRDYYVGMVGVNLRERPLSVARHIAATWGADSWSLHTEAPRKNVLICVATGGIENVELMRGLGWASELPMQAIKKAEDRERVPSGHDHEGAWKAEIRCWVGDRSVFAKREGVQCTIGLPILSGVARAAVLFLNFPDGPSPEKRDLEALAMVANELRGSVEQVWGSQQMQGVMDRGQCKGADVLKAIRAAVSEGPGERISSPVAKSLETAAMTLWRPRDVTCKVHALNECLRLQDGQTADLGDERFVNNARPDNMVKRSSALGETFYVDDLNQNDVRARFDPDGRIRMGLVQKLVIPIRCEPFLEWESPSSEPATTAAQNGSRIYKDPTPAKDFVSWGALSVESPEKVFSVAQLQELNVLAHIVASGLYLRLAARKEQNDDRCRFFTDLFDAMHHTLEDIEENSWKRKSSEQTESGPLDGFCKAVITKKLMGEFERCDFYPYDHLAGTFQNGGCYTATDWIKTIRESFGTALVEKDDTVKYLHPRKGGNSEGLLGVRSQTLSIDDAEKFASVSPVTKAIGTHTLIGRSCKTGFSFRSEGVLWLGTRGSLGPDFLTAEGGKYQWQLGIITHVLALFCAALRWWEQEEKPSNDKDNTEGKAE
ncbi:MAG: helix-turn-helix domain-containing protein [Planctomycetota bacterium]|jgi:hypothetical protein